MKRFEVTGTVRVTMTKEHTAVVEAEDEDTAKEEFESLVEEGVADGSISFTAEDPEDARVISPTVKKLL